MAAFLALVSHIILHSVNALEHRAVEENVDLSRIIQRHVEIRIAI